MKFISLVTALLASAFIISCSTDSTAKIHPVKKIVVYEVTDYYNSIWFANNTDKINEDFDLILELNAKYLQQHPQAIVQIQGNTSEVGSNEFNYKLGQNRSQMVKTKLLALGVAESQIETISFGATRPVIMKQSEVSVATFNRRADIIYISGAPRSYYVAKLPIVTTDNQSLDFNALNIIKAEPAYKIFNNNLKNTASMVKLTPSMKIDSESPAITASIAAESTL
ncbi:MAG: hypothetical protein RL017_342, partial [Pseudomonadota bacterium]